ncbi:MAG: hypothetical protein Q9202_000026 [Teloschistes flavicans]
MAAPVPTFWDALARKLGNPEITWYYDLIDPFIAMAQIAPGSSILDLGCSNAVVALAAKRASGPGDQLVVGIDLSHGMLQVARELWEHHAQNQSVPNTIRLYCGDIKNLDAVEGLQQSLGPEVKFDHILARYALDHFEPEEIVTTLRHWATYKKPQTGKITTTFGLADIAGILLVNKHTGKIIRRRHMMTEAEWVRGEDNFRNIVARAGLTLQSIQRVGFQGGDDVPAWEEEGDYWQARAVLQHAMNRAHGEMQPEWSNADGSVSALFKRQMKYIEYQMAEANQRASGTVGEGVQPMVAALAGVIV